MRGLAKLIGNENKKTFKQTGMRVILIIIAVISLLFPLLLRATTTLNSAASSIINNDEMIASMIDQCKQNGDLPGEKYWRTYERANELINKKIDPKDAEWKREIFFRDYTYRLGWLGILECISTGKYTVDDLFETSLATYMYSNDLDIIPSDIYSIDQKTAKELLPKLELEIAKFESNAISYSLYDYYKVNLDNAEKERDECAETLKIYESGAAVTPDYVSSAENVEAYSRYMTDVAKNQLKAAELKVYGWQLMCEKLYEYNSWQYNTVSALIENICSRAAYSVVMPRELFGSDDFFPDGSVRYDSYEDYVNTIQADRWHEAAALAKYSLEHNIPLNGTTDRSAKQAFVSAFSMTLSMLVIFMIILSGTTMSGEYSTGTIRLLLIRPRGRGKILTSKIISMYIWWSGAALVFALLLCGETVILYGIKDMFSSDLFTVGGSVIALPAPVTLILRILLSMLSTSPVVLFALMISTLIKRSALPIALSTMARFSTSIVTTLTFAINSYLKKIHLEYTPLPYLDLTVFLSNSASAYTNWGNFADILFGTGTTLNTNIYRLPIGIAWMAGLTVLMTVLSYLSFTKQQIKN